MQIRADNSIAVWALPAYTMAGVHAEIRTMFAQSAHKYIVASRIAQGNQDHKNSSAEEREDIEVRWLSLKDKMRGFYTLKQNEKGKSREASLSVPNHEKKAAYYLDELRDERRFQEQKKAWKKKRAEGPFVEEDIRSVSTTGNTRELGDEFEAAIQAAVHETSRGNAIEDARIEQAIRSSVSIMRTRSTTVGSSMSSNSGFSNASTQPSRWAPDVKRPHRDERREYPFSPDDLENITDEEYQALIEEAIKLSITEKQQAIAMHDLEGEDGEDDENMRRALEKSQTEGIIQHDEEYKKTLEASQAEHENAEFDEEALRQAIAASQAEQQVKRQQPDDDEELQRALEESEKAHRQELARISSLRSEEDIVMEYVKKQSLAEAAFRHGTGINADVSAEDDEEKDLRRALEESMKTDDVMRRGGGGGPS